MHTEDGPSLCLGCQLCWGIELQVFSSLPGMIRSCSMSHSGWLCFLGYNVGLELAQSNIIHFFLLDDISAVFLFSLSISIQCNLCCILVDVFIVT